MRVRKRNNNNEEENVHRWLISYSDFLTLLFTFFVALYALSSVDVTKAEKMTSSLRKVFKVIDEPVSFEEDRNKAIIEDLRKLLNDISGINIKSDARGIVITLPDSLLFSSGSAELKPESTDALTRIAEKLKELPGKVAIEGHTDNIPISSSVYKSNWELSAARASSVLHFLLQRGLSPDRFLIAGYGEYKPVATNDTDEGRAKNRRVELIILR
ncbi:MULTISPECIES: OmpA/MotB family protein [Thermodesulfovibrio]|uniref:Chemotaxis protein MotB n=2 Tax=Thermodesulfovibrio yellowstonii TaxID=28262 RepID=B5YK91_THEYD|nr:MULTISPECIES: OmpA family protein [Thermodesulfovibrio]ACI20276.1 chemotaxis protein MotB [Thermodesulfovibrio yellowstonii DSM 11347]GLI53795.1 chemotaxis protein MotB [Thermodesulfovibrio islandicus]